MKNFITLIYCSFFLNLFCYGQQSLGYDLQITSAPLTPLENATLLISNTEDTFAKKIILPFEFSLNNDVVSDIWISQVGALSTKITDDEIEDDILIGYYSENGFDQTLYVIENDILKVEWQNNTTAILQIWLYKNGKVDFRYGDQFNLNTEESILAIVKNYNSDEDIFSNGWLLQNDGTNEFLMEICEVDIESSSPKNNQIYEFTPFLSDANKLPYEFTTVIESYNELENATEITFDDADFVLDLPFNFSVFDTTSNQLFVSAGVIALETATENTYNYIIPAAIYDEFESMDVSYTITGESGNQIVKIQWKDAEIYDNLGNWMNFQAWIYENGTIEYRYGSSQIADSVDIEHKLLIGFIQNYSDDTDNIENLWYFNGNGDAPNLERICNIDYGFLDLLSLPIENRVYRFTKNTVDVADYQLDRNIKISPTITHGTVQISSDEPIEEIQIFNTTGVLIQNHTSHIENTYQLDLSNVQNGNYFIRMTTNNGVITKKVVKL